MSLFFVSKICRLKFFFLTNVPPTKKGWETLGQWFPTGISQRVVRCAAKLGITDFSLMFYNTWCRQIVILTNEVYHQFFKDLRGTSDQKKVEKHCTRLYQWSYICSGLWRNISWLDGVSGEEDEIEWIEEREREDDQTSKPPETVAEVYENVQKHWNVFFDHNIRNHY